jgi:hypothetical protein
MADDTERPARRAVTQEEIDRVLNAPLVWEPEAARFVARPWPSNIDYATGVDWAAVDDAAVPKPATSAPTPTAFRRLRVRFARTETFEAEVAAPLSLEIEDLTGKELKALVFAQALNTQDKLWGVWLKDDNIEIHSVEILEEMAVEASATTPPPRRVFTLIREFNVERRDYESPEVLGVFVSRGDAEARRDELAAEDEQGDADDRLRVYYRNPYGDGWDLDYTITESEVEG